MKPILLIDIDGVLCPFDTEDTEHLEPIIGHEWAVMDRRHTAWLKELGELYRLAWCSYWERGGNDVIGMAHDLDPIPFVVFNTVNPYDQTYKLHEVKEFIGDEPMAWIDDGFFADAFKWAGERNKTVPTRLIHTDPAKGLDEAAMQDLRQFGYTFANS